MDVFADVNVDWSAPWLAPWAEIGQRVDAQWRSGMPLAEALNAQRGPLAAQFVPQSALPKGTAYERFIFETRQIPTRENLHDFFNGLVWLKFPKTKAALNAMQFAQIERDGIRGTRGPVRDAVTVFDENGAVWLGDPDVWRALGERRWKEALWSRRAAWREGGLVLMGHALLEKLCKPRLAITAHVWCLPAAQTITTIEDLDALMAAQAAEKIPAKPFAALPVLGVPGWWPDNERIDFYDNVSVFRPARTS